MKTFKVKVVTTITNICEVEAETLEEAKEKASSQESNIMSDDVDTTVYVLSDDAE